MVKQYLYEIWRRFRGGSTRTEPTIHRKYLFEELLRTVPALSWAGKRILEIGPKDGMDSQRLASLQPSELVMIELPLKDFSAKPWLAALPCPHRLIEANFMYLPPELESSLGPLTSSGARGCCIIIRSNCVSYGGFIAG